MILKDETFALRNWPLANITCTFHGDDGLVRTVELLCQGRHYKRATNRLVLLIKDQSSPGSDRMRMINKYTWNTVKITHLSGYLALMPILTNRLEIFHGIQGILDIFNKFALLILTYQVI